MSVVFSVIFDGIGKKAHIWDEIARAKGARPEWDYYISRYRQQRAMSVQWKIIVKCPHCSAVKVFVWIKIWYSLAKRNVIYTILNSENVNEVSQVNLGVSHGSLGHQKEIANLILGKLALETWPRCGENVSWIVDCQMMLFQYEPILNGKFLIIFNNFEKSPYVTWIIYSKYSMKLAY